MPTRRPVTRARKRKTSATTKLRKATSSMRKATNFFKWLSKPYHAPGARRGMKY